jgi:ABC-2 type transport system permease protein
MHANPVIVKELRGRMRGWRSVVILVIYLLILSFITWLTFLAVGAWSSGFGGPEAAQVGKVIFSVLVIFQMVMVALFTPAFTAGAITSEREQKTYDLLMTTLLPARSVIFGKLGSAVAWVALLILAVAPLESLAFLFGGVSPEEVILSQVVMLIAAILFASIGIFWSCVVRSSVASNVLTYGSIIFQLLLLPFLYFLVFTIIGTTGTYGDRFTDQPAFYYLSGLVLSFQPVIAMGISDAFYSQGQSLFIYTSDEILRGHTLLVISPWLLFCIEALWVSAFLVIWSIRLVKPIRYKRQSRPPAPANPESLSSGNVSAPENVSTVG